MTQEGKPVLVRMSDVEPEEVEWLWETYVPLGKITLLEGDPGGGKTTLALQLAASVSAGRPLPDYRTGELEQTVAIGGVLYLTGEDGLGDTIRPRLDAAGADAERVYVLTGKRDQKEGLEAITLADVETIEEAIERIQPALVVVDPLQAYLGAGVNMNRANAVRPLLAELGRLAEKHRFAVVFIRHLSKSNSKKSIYRGMGSVDFSAAARSILLVGVDPNEPENRAVIQIKNSLRREGPAQGFQIDEDGFHWTGLSKLTEEKLLSENACNRGRLSKLEIATEFLQEELAEHAVAQELLLAKAKRLGISEATLYRAKSRLGIVSKKLEGLGQHAPWAWKMPEGVEGDDHPQVEG